MPHYTYQAARSDGELFTGQIEAEDVQAAAQQLQSAGHMPLKIDLCAVDKPKTSHRFQQWLSSRALQARDIELFTLELCTLLKAGLPLGQALQRLHSLTKKPALQAICHALSQAIRRGESLSFALQNSHAFFDRLYCNMVKVGEASGTLELALQSLVQFHTQRRALRESLLSALIYPCILVLLALVAMAVLLVFVIPQFTDMFVQAGQAMPLLTRIMVGVGDFVRHYGWFLLGIGAIGIGLLRRHWQQGAGREQRDRLILRLPIVGALVLKLETARFSRTLATLLQRGMSVLPALDIAQEVINNQIMASVVAHAATGVRQGQNLSDPLLASQRFPALATQLIQVGEQTGHLAPMLVQVADIYETEVQTGLKRLLGLIEPMIIILIAVFVTVVILSIVSLMMASNQLLF